MPYSGAGDRSLPKNVREMPLAKRRQWVAVFNKTFANCKGSKKKCDAEAFRLANGAVKEMTMETDYAKMVAKMHEIADREGKVIVKDEANSPSPAFADLWEAAAKELKAEADFARYLKPLELSGTKPPDCGGKGCAGEEKCGACMPDPPYVSLGGATSFAEADAYDEAENIEFHVREQERLFRRITENIFTSEDMTLPEKLAKVKAAATELEGRLEKPPGEKGLLDRVKDMVGLGSKVQAVDDEPTIMLTREIVAKTVTTENPGALSVFKNAKGEWRFLTLTSNMWRDRDGEIIPASAHEKNVAYAESTKDMPELRLWHVPGSRVGVADWIDYAHGFLLHSGGFDKGMEHVAKSLAASEEPLGVSHGFYYEKDEGSDVYRSYRDFEVSVLPLDRAANQWTEFTADNTEEEAMGISKERREFLVTHMGEDQVGALDRLLEEKEQDLKDGKVDFKEVLAEAIEATAEPDPKPAEGDKGGEPDVVGTEVVEVLTKMTETVEGIAAAQVEQAEQIKALQASDEEKIAAKMLPARKPPPDGGKPTESKTNVLSIEEAKAKGAEEADALPDNPGGRAMKQIQRSHGTPVPTQ